MASRFQQRALIRKVIYLALILVVLTISLLHRNLVVIPQAYALQLREESRGEVELTSAALRVGTTGLRGWVTCGLWLRSIEATRKHEWNQVELAIRSITKLQPYYVEPWLYQCWHLAFNVAVEFDRVKDKYFYITRGLELLSEGERRNQGYEYQSAADSRRLRFPGNPMMRYYMGFFYQLKIGQGDDQDALRCLYDMSCIDPAERDPGYFARAGAEGQDVDLVRFEQFCRKYPRLVRRLRESPLACDSPLLVIGFLKDNKDVPCRFETPQLSPGAERKQTPLKPLTERFPVLPPPPPEVLAQYAPADRYKIDDVPPTGEDFDVFGACRLWYEYAQQPLPPPNPDPGVHDPEFNRAHFDPVLHRMPKMAIQIFRHYPARAKTFHAEVLQQEGWFDADGWLVKQWFADLHPNGEVRIGTEQKYHDGPAWEKSHQMYAQYGRENGLNLTNRKRYELLAKARPYLAKHEISFAETPDQLSPADQAAGLAESHDAALKLRYNEFYRSMTNFDAYFYQTNVERQPETVAARKAFFQAERLRRFEAAPKEAMDVYAQTFPAWLSLLLKYPDFSRISQVQEDTYEMQMRYIRLLQSQYDSDLKPLVTWLAQVGLKGPVPPLLSEAFDNEQAKIIPIRKVRGPFEMVYVFDWPNEALYSWITSPALRPLLIASPPLRTWLTRQMFTVSKERAPEGTKFAPGWRPLIDDEVIRQVRLRMGITRPNQPELPTSSSRARKQ
jgi:hypothetical protein